MKQGPLAVPRWGQLHPYSVAIHAALVSSWGFRVWGFGFRVWGLGFKARGSVFSVVPGERRVVGTCRDRVKAVGGIKVTI